MLSMYASMEMPYLNCSGTHAIVDPRKHCLFHVRFTVGTLSGLKSSYMGKILEQSISPRIFPMCKSIAAHPQTVSQNPVQFIQREPFLNYPNNFQCHINKSIFYVFNIILEIRLLNSSTKF